MNHTISGLDIFLIPFYMAMILAIGYAFSRRLSKVIRGYFMKGLALKLICGLGFAWVYVYYYGGGDTQMYFRGATAIYNAVMAPGGGLGEIFNEEILRYGSLSTHFTQRIAGFINLFAFNSFWTCTLLFATLSFLGLWLLFISFYRLFPILHKEIAIATLFIPGVVFWSSGIMKDSICMLFIGVIVYSIQNILLLNRKMVLSAILLFIGFYVIANLKAYIAIALLLSIALYALLAIKTKIKNPSVRKLLMPIAGIIIIGGALAGMNTIGESFERYSLENLAETAQTYQGYHERISYEGRGSVVRTGSGYTLGETDFNNPLSIFAKLPVAVNVTLFRPYIWEVRNPVMLLSALESSAILVFTLMVLWKVGLIRFFKSIGASKEVLFCFTFAIIFGFAVGFTTYNFGSLVRYKAPCIPFYLLAIIIIYYQSGKSKFGSVPLKTKSRVMRISPSSVVQS